MAKIRDLTGMRFGRLVAVERHRDEKGITHYVCQCDCGHTTVVRHGALTHRETRSCGCLRKDLLRKPRRKGERGMSHGMRHAPEYKCWQGMRDRCLTPTCKDYARYGGRGITIDPRWTDFTVFLADVGRRPGRTYSLHRVNNNGNYEPGNVVWALPKEQARNRRPARRGVYVKPRLTAWTAAPQAGALPAIQRIYGAAWPATTAHPLAISQIVNEMFVHSTG